MLAKQVCFLRVLTVPSRPQGANRNASRASTGLDRYCEYPPASNMVVKSSIHWHLPLGKLTVGPWKSPRNWVETHLSTRNWQGRHVNLLGYRWPSSINWDFRIFQPPEGEKSFILRRWIWAWLIWGPNLSSKRTGSVLDHETLAEINGNHPISKWFKFAVYGRSWTGYLDGTDLLNTKHNGWAYFVGSWTSRGWGLT